MNSRAAYIPYSRQAIDEGDIRAVSEALRSDFITQGPRVAEFEKAVAEYCGAKFAVAVSSGTAALHLACLAAGIGPGDEVITSPITFVASANCALYCGGRPVFADVRPDTINIDPAEIEQQTTPRTRAIIPVHFAGHPCDMDEIHAIAGEHNLTVIEDACHALGAEFKGRKIGSLSDMTVLSFHPVKHITTGEGGMVLTDREDFYEKLLMLRTHGITRDPARLIENHGPWYYEMQHLGFNYRLTDIQCALGISQMGRLDSFVERRRQIAERYNRAFSGVGGIVAPVELPGVASSYHLYVIQIDEEKAGVTRLGLFNALRADGIGVNVHYIPVHLQPYYRERLGHKPGDYPVSERYYGRCISLPVHQGMSDEDVDRVVSSVLGRVKT